MIEFTILASFLSLLLHLLQDVQNFVAVAAVAVAAVAVGDGGCLGVSEASWGADSAAGWPRIAQSGRKRITIEQLTFVLYAEQFDNWKLKETS